MPQLALDILPPKAPHCFCWQEVVGNGAALHSLRVLDLRSNNIDDAGVTALAAVLRRHGALSLLEYIDLADNPVSTDGRDVLAAARSNVTLRWE